MDRLKIMERNNGSIKNNMVVTAGAGTGKTTCLVKKIVSLIGEAYVPVEKILAITFTEAAAAEMVERLRIEIERRARDESGDVWKAARDDLERAQISTIHSLGARILRENPIEAGIDPDFTIEEEALGAFTTDEIWEAWAGENLWGGRDFDDDLVTLLKRFGVEGIRDIGMELVKRPDRLDDYLIYRVDGEEEKREFKERLAKIRDELYRIEIEADEDDLLYQKCIKAKEVLSLKSLEEMAESLEGANLKKVGGREDKWSFSDAFASTKEMFYQPGGVIDTLKEIKPFLEQLEDHEIAGTAVRVISDFVRYLREEKIGRGVLTYFDLLYEAKKLLQERPEIRRRYQREFDYILVDEFQDTDPIQGNMILFLAEDGARAERPEDVKIKRDRLFIVGDPKQSIFRFREAEIEVFYRVEKKIEESGGKKRVLSNSYRSQKHLIAFHNALFSDYIRHEDEGYTVGYDPLTPMIEDVPDIDGAPPAVDIVTVDSAERQSADEVRETEAEYIASRIVNMVEGQAEGKIVRDRETKEPRAVGYGDIAILMRTMTGVSIYEQALKREGVPYIIVGGRGYFQRQEVNDLINILGALLDPTDKRALVGVLRSPVFGIDDETIYRLAEGGSLGYREVAEAAGDDRVERAYEILRHLHGVRGGTTLSGLIDEIFDKTEIVEINGFGTGGAQRVGNLMKIGRIAGELESAGPVTLTSFIHLLRELAVVEPDEEEAVVTEEVENSVRIMTIHKAKGLEFPVVFLPNLGRGLTPDPRDGIYTGSISGRDISGINLERRNKRLPKKRLVSDLGYNRYFRERERVRNLAEERRIFYVAATRARDRLILIGKQEGSKESCMKDILEFVAAGETEGEKVDLPFARLVSITGEGAKATFRKRKPEISKFIEGTGNRKPVEEARAREKERHEEYERALNVSLYGSVTGEAKDVPEVFESADSIGGDLLDGEVGRTFAAGPGPSPTAGDAPLLEGSLFHALLEGIDFTNPPGGGDIERQVSGASLTLTIDDDIRDGVISEAAELVRKFLASDTAREIASSEIIGREVPLFTSQGGKTLAGRIDLIYRKDGEMKILDYKTDTVDAGGEDSAAERYRPQMETYVKVVSAALGGRAEGLSIRGAVHFVRTGVTVSVVTLD